MVNQIRLTLTVSELQALRSLVHRLNEAITYNVLIESEALTSADFSGEVRSTIQALSRNGCWPPAYSEFLGKSDADRTT